LKSTKSATDIGSDNHFSFHFHLIIFSFPKEDPIVKIKIALKKFKEIKKWGTLAFFEFPVNFYLFNFYVTFKG